MNILYISKLYYHPQIHPYGGVHNSCQVKALTVMGHNVRVIHVLRPGYQDKLPFKQTREGIDIYCVKPVYADNPVGDMLTILTVYRQIKRAASDGGFLNSTDIIISNALSIETAAVYLLAKRYKKRLHLVFTGSDIYRYKFHGDIRKQMTRHIIGGADKRVAVSYKLKNDIKRLGIYKGHIDVSVIGVDKDMFRPLDRNECRNRLSLPLKSRIILTVGNDVHVKGLDTAVKAFINLYKDVKDVFLVCMTNDESVDRLRLLTRMHDVEHRILFVHPERQQRFAWWINASDCICVSSRYEGCSALLLETLACSRPVVSTNVGCAQSVLENGKGAWVVKGDNPDALAKAIKEALSYKDTKSILQFYNDKIPDWREHSKELL